MMNSFEFKILLTPRYRALLLDIVTFIVNLIIMFFFMNLLANLAAQSKQGVGTAKILLAIFLLSLVFLQPLGAILKRQQVHQRITDFKPVVSRFILVLYFITQFMFLIIASTLIMESYGKNDSAPTELVVVLFSGIPGLALINTFVVYSYFKPPSGEPFFYFLKSPRSENLGDACVFLSMFCYQLFWTFLLDDPYFHQSPKEWTEVISKMISFFMLALFIYLPPRIFEIYQSTRSWKIWFSMFIANLPVIFRILYGSG
jgi:hypothetical protein